MKAEKQMFDKQIFAGYRDRRTQRGILTDFARFLPVCLLSSCCITFGDGCLPGSGPLFAFFRKLRERSKALWALFVFSSRKSTCQRLVI